MKSLSAVSMRNPSLIAWGWSREKNALIWGGVYIVVALDLVAHLLPDLFEFFAVHGLLPSSGVGSRLAARGFEPLASARLYIHQSEFATWYPSSVRMRF